MAGTLLAAAVVGTALIVLDLRAPGRPAAGVLASSSASPSLSASGLMSAPPLGSTPFPLSSATATSAIPLADISSTVTAASPLAVYPSLTNPGQLIARNYQGTVVGTFSMNADFRGDFGYLVSPDGSKVYLGDGVVMGIDGVQLGVVPTAQIPFPVWGDDSDHLCGVSSSADLLEVTVTGAIVSSTPLGTSDATVVGCSPDSDRAVMLTAGAGGQANGVAVAQLSTGTMLATHATADYGMASHNCQLFASDGPNGVTIRNVATWAVVGEVDRQVEFIGGTGVAAAYEFSWDGSLLVLQYGAAKPPITTFVVALSDGATLLQSQDVPETNELGFGGPDVIPLVGTSELLLSERGGVYLLGAGGQLTALPG